MEHSKILNLIGFVDIPAEFDVVFSEKESFLVTNVISKTHFFEIVGETMYYALKEYEKYSKLSQLDKKRKIVDAIIKRKEFCGGTFYHNALSGEGKDTQLRATSAVIRTLLAAEKDGFYCEKELKEIVEHHFSYYFQWNDGIWFCHDTSERDGRTPKSHLKTRKWNKLPRNTVTLNTHLDSLTTLLLLLKEKTEYIQRYSGKAKKAIIAINNVLETKNKKGRFRSCLQSIDNLFFSNYLKKAGNENFLWKVYQKIVHPLVFKLFSPTLFFKNGYIGRDLSVMNIHLDYLLVNTTDFLRLLVVYESLSSELKEIIGVEFKKEILLEILSSTMKLVHTKKGFRDYVSKSDLQKAWYAETLYLYNVYDKSYSNELKIIEQSDLYNLDTTVFADILQNEH